MANESNVQIFNEAGTAQLATGQTADGGATVTHLTAAVVYHREYQLSVGGGQRRGVICTGYNAGTATATFA